MDINLLEITRKKMENHIRNEFSIFTKINKIQIISAITIIYQTCGTLRCLSFL